MRIGIQIFVTARKAITIESGEYGTPVECMQDIEYAVHHVKVKKVKDNLISLFGDE